MLPGPFHSLIPRPRKSGARLMTEPTDDLDSEPAPQPVLEEGIDYYLENGLMVFTATFLQKRGYCCERGCRHCPYGYSKEEDGSRQ